MKAKKKPSGKNIPEAQRKTVAVKLRLPIEAAEELDGLAKVWKLTRSGTVARLLLAFTVFLGACAGSSNDGDGLRRCDSNDDCRDLFNVKSRCVPWDGGGFCGKPCESTEECRRDHGPNVVCEERAEGNECVVSPVP